MRIGVPRERAAHERRVAIVPDTVSRLVKGKHEVFVEHDAGAAAGFPDAQYLAVGARVVEDAAQLLGGSDLILKVQRPSREEALLIAERSILVSFLAPASSQEVLS